MVINGWREKRIGVDEWREQEGKKEQFDDDKAAPAISASSHGLSLSLLISDPFQNILIQVSLLL